MLEVFVRQVLQLVPLQQLCWPSPEELRSINSQRYIWERCFRTGETAFLPPERYRYAVLKALLRRVENAIVDPEEDEISDDLMNALSELMETELPSELEAAQKRSWVTYTFADEDSGSHRGSVRLLENRSVIAGSGTTGLRTWEAALHLGEYLLSDASAQNWIKGKTVLELGAGTGLLSMLCSHPLGAAAVLCTDGSEEVTVAVRENLVWNENVNNLEAGVLRWGWGLEDSVAARYINNGCIDTVIGADVTYDKSVIPALIATIRQIFERWPKADVIISATIRNEDTFAAFESACESNAFLTRDLPVAMQPLHKQERLFYSSAVPIRIFHVQSGGKLKDPFQLG